MNPRQKRSKMETNEPKTNKLKSKELKTGD